MRGAIERKPSLPIRAIKSLGKALDERSPRAFIPLTALTGAGAIAAIDQGKVVFAVIDSAGAIASAGVVIAGIRDRLRPPQPEMPERIIYIHPKNKKRRQERKKLKR